MFASHQCPSGGRWIALLAATLALASTASGKSKQQVLHDFTGGKDGCCSVSPLIFDDLGNLYGTTVGGGDRCQCGTIFELKASNGGWSYSVLYRFKGGVDGQYPLGGLVLDRSGNLYGTTQAGGIYNRGTVFQLARSSADKWQERVLFSFTGGATGGDPAAGLVIDGDGNLYGTTPDGGDPRCDYGCGVVFDIWRTRSGVWKQTVIHRFTGFDGVGLAGLTLDAAGNHLYGTTTGRDGAARQGRYSPDPCFAGGGGVFQLTSAKKRWAETRLYCLNTTSGDYPMGGVVLDKAGNVFGTGYYGGYGNCADGFGCGAVFEVRRSGNAWSEHTIYTFAGGNDGGNPASALTFDRNGSLYGTTVGGGGSERCYDGCGTVFRLTRNEDGAWREVILHRFSGGVDGANPSASVVLDRNGILYGTAASGGTHNEGVVYKISP